MMRDLQYVGMQFVRAREERLCLALDVAGEEDCPPARCHAQDNRGVVFGTVLEGAVRGERGDAQATELDGPRILLRANEPDWYRAHRDRLQQPLRALPAETARREPHLADIEAADDGRQTTAVIGMNVRCDEEVDPPDTAVDQQWQQRRLAKSWSVVAPAAVHEQHASAIADQDRIALPDGEHGQPR